MTHWCLANAVAVLLIGCSTDHKAVRPVESLPTFGPEEATWFDDAFGGDSDETDSDVLAAQEQPKLERRVLFADSVLPVKISTVTSDRHGSYLAYQLVLSPTGPALAGESASQPVALAVTSASTSYPLVRAADAALIGKRLVVFLRRYAIESGPVLHWHAEPDTPEIRRAVQQASSIRRASQ